jgi:hypothetical protein
LPERTAVLTDALSVRGVVPPNGARTSQLQSRPKVVVNATLSDGLVLMETLCGAGAPAPVWYEKLSWFGVAVRESVLTVRLTGRFSELLAA